MRRSFATIDGRPQVSLVDVAAADTLAVERAIEVFRGSTNHDADALANVLLQDFHVRRISADTIESLSRWANSGGTFASAVDPARNVANLLLGCPLLRLIDEHGDRMSDYAARVEHLAYQIGLA